MSLFDDEIIIDNSNGKFLITKSAFRKKLKFDNRDLYLKNEFPEFPKNGEVVFIKSNGLSDTGSFFRNLANEKKLNELWLSTWVISRENIQSIIKAIDEERLSKCFFVVSTRLKQLKKSNYAFLVEEFKKRNDKCFFKVCNSHAKTFSVSDFEGNLYTITGSGNWTENPRIENYVIFNDKFAFEHNKNWMSEILF